MPKGRIIVFEGTDGSGKKTQWQLLCGLLDRRGIHYTPLDYPDYESPSSALVRMYLSGAFGSDPAAVNPYAASSFYAVDRYASFKTRWEAEYLAGGLFPANRYTTSNAVHQSAKLPPEERLRFLRWLREYEHGLLGIPEPDMVLFFDMPPDYSAELLRRRRAEGGGAADDIHERDPVHLAEAYLAAAEAADVLGWRRIICVRDGAIRSPEDIHSEAAGLCGKLLY